MSVNERIQFVCVMALLGLVFGASVQLTLYGLAYILM
jgi:hypothetical protein